VQLCYAEWGAIRSLRILCWRLDRLMANEIPQKGSRACSPCGPLRSSDLKPPRPYRCKKKLPSGERSPEAASPVCSAPFNEHVRGTLWAILLVVVVPGVRRAAGAQDVNRPSVETLSNDLVAANRFLAYREAFDGYGHSRSTALTSTRDAHSSSSDACNGMCYPQTFQN
jgi:hypothetical protein